MIQTSPAYSVFYIVCQFIFYFSPLFSAILWKNLLDMVSGLTKTENIKNVFFLLVVYLIVQLVHILLENLNTLIYERICRTVALTLDKKILFKMASLDEAYTDAPENRNNISAAQTSEQYIVDNMSWAVSITIRIIAFIASLTVLFSYQWIIGIIYLLTYIPSIVTSHRQRQKADQFSIDNIPQNRKKDYYKSLLTQSFAAKDLRLYSLESFYKNRYTQLWRDIRVERNKIFAKGSVFTFLGSLVNFAGFICIFIFSIISIIQGHLSLGTFVLFVSLIETTGAEFERLLGDIACQFEIDIPHVLRYINFLKIPVKEYGERIIENVSPRIEFKNVYFTYPGNESPTLVNLSFSIKEGEKIAIVGINGAGKSTIIKLLLGIYSPDSGEILINGISIQEYAATSLNTLFSVCFQEINEYALSLKENIAISDITRVHNTQDINAAATAAKIDFITDLPLGLETQLTRSFDEAGVALSGGQLQKISIARTFFKNSAFFILDEPTSALDPEAENYIFESFRDLCKEKGGILISHRLSSVMIVDRIFVISNGTLVESGTHTNLMHQQGEYYKLYTLQASKYLRKDKNCDA